MVRKINECVCLCEYYIFIYFSLSFPLSLPHSFSSPPLSCSFSMYLFVLPWFRVRLSCVSSARIPLFFPSFSSLDLFGQLNFLYSNLSFSWNVRHFGCVLICSIHNHEILCFPCLGFCVLSLY